MYKYLLGILLLCGTCSAGVYPLGGNVVINIDTAGANVALVDKDNNFSVSQTAPNFNATYGVHAATGVYTGAVDMAGQVTMGAAATKSTFTTTGDGNFNRDISAGRDLSITRNAAITGTLDVVGQVTFGAAVSKSTMATTGIISAVGFSGPLTGAVTGAASSNLLKAGDTMTGKLGLLSKSKAELHAITPAAVGEVYFCNDTSPARIAVSTGTAAGNFGDAMGLTLY